MIQMKKEMLVEFVKEKENQTLKVCFNVVVDRINL